MNDVIKPTKEDLTCAFHKDFENKVCSMKKRLDLVVLIVIVNLLLNGREWYLSLLKYF